MSLRATAVTGRTGPVVVVLLPVALAVVWLLERPAREPWGSYLGQLAGAEAVLLMSTAMVLISTLPLVDSFFDGIDRAAIWHRRLAITGLVLLAPHILLSSGGSGSSWSGPAGVVGAVGLITLAVWAILPRWRSLLPRAVQGVAARARELPGVDLLSRLLGNYEVWRSVHRLTGLFLAVAVAHGLVDATVFGSPVLRWTYLVTSSVGLGFYLYRELLARRGHGLRDYQVARVSPVGTGLTEIALIPLGRPLRYTPGQFAMLHLESAHGWQRHPFTLAGSPDEPELRVTVKALGDWTGRITDEVRPGMPAVLSGPHGRFSHARGRDRQLWIAGGVGITPFLSWMRSLEAHPPPGPVDLFYSVADEAAYADELAALAEASGLVTLHVVRTRYEPRLTAAEALRRAGAEASEVSVFLCGPEPMVRTLQRDLAAAGVPRSRVHREHFDWR